MKFCPQCGTTFEPEARFCLECGFDRSTVEAVENKTADAAEEIVEEPSVTPVVPVETTSSEPEIKPACPKCNTAIEPGERFCAECGFDTSGAEAVENKTADAIEENVEVPSATPVIPVETTSAEPEIKPACPKCSYAIEPGERFCPECGFDTTATVEPVIPEIQAPTEAEKVVEEVIIPVPPIPEPVSEIANNQFCPQCGTVLNADDRFCLECGYDTSAQEQAVQAKVTAAVPPVVIPPKPEAVRAQTATYNAPVSSVGTSSPGKSRKPWLMIALIVIGVGVLGAAGWYGYTNYFSTPAETTVDNADNTLVPEIPQAEDDAAMDMDETEQTGEPTAENPAATSKSQSRIDQELAKYKSKESNKPTQQTSTQAKPAKPDLGVKVNPGAAASNIKLEVLLDVGRKETPKSKKPKNPTKLMIQKPTMIVRITTDHYNDGMGTSGGGTISIKDRDGNMVGSFRAYGKTGANGAPNAKWVASPNKMLDKGTYYIWDSDMATWSKNFVGNGFVMVEGYEIK